MASIKVSPKHGINPSLNICAFCGKESGEVLLVGRLPNDAEAPRQMISNPHEPCDNCKKAMQQGITFIKAEPHPQWQWIPRGFIVIKRDAAFIDDILEPMRSQILKQGAALIDPKDWEKMGFPSEEIGGTNG